MFMFIGNWCPFIHTHPYWWLVDIQMSWISWTIISSYKKCSDDYHHTVTWLPILCRITNLPGLHFEYSAKYSRDKDLFILYRICGQTGTSGSQMTFFYQSEIVFSPDLALVLFVGIHITAVLIWSLSVRGYLSQVSYQILSGLLTQWKWHRYT